MIVLMLVPNVLAESVINFNSTANFDAGTKTNVGTISDDCTVASNTFQILTSVGTNGINSNCIIGSPKVATTGIKISYDMETLASGSATPDLFLVSLLTISRLQAWPILADGPRFP